MGRAKPWAKLWVNWYHKAEWLSMSLAEKGAWWLLYSLAQELEGDGRMVATDGTPMSIRHLNKSLHLEDPAERRIFRRMLDKRRAQGALHWDGDVLVLTEFAGEQERTPSNQKEAVAERVRRHRASRSGAVGGNVHGQTGDNSVTDNRLPADGVEAEISDTAGQSVTDVTPLPLSPLSSVSSQEDGGAGEGTTASITGQAMVAELSRCYEANIGLLSGTTRELFEEFLEEYHGPVAWIADAFKEGVRYNHRSWAYIRKILMNWQEQGRRDESHGRQTDRDETPERDPLAGARESGWKVRTVREHDGPEDEDAD